VFRHALRLHRHERDFIVNYDSKRRKDEGKRMKEKAQRAGISNAELPNPRSSEVEILRFAQNDKGAKGSE
jgi:hypothetical protein